MTIFEVKNKLVDKIGSALLRDNTSEDFVHLAEAVYILLTCEEYEYLQEFNIDNQLTNNKIDIAKIFGNLKGLFPKDKD